MCYTRYKTLASVSMVFAFVQLIKTLSEFGSFKRLTNMMWRSISELFFFLLMFLVMVIGFAVAYHIIYGQHIIDFHTFFKSFISMFSIVIGNYDESAIFGAEASFTTSSKTFIFFWAYNIGMVWILLNVFITICMDAYEGAKDMMEDRKKKVSEHMRILSTCV
jgi:hypothetical protein